MELRVSREKDCGTHVLVICSFFPIFERDDTNPEGCTSWLDLSEPLDGWGRGSTRLADFGRNRLGSERELSAVVDAVEEKGGTRTLRSASDHCCRTSQSGILESIHRILEKTSGPSR